MDKPVVLFKSAIKTPPFSAAARKEVGILLRLVQKGHLLPMPHSRPMPSIGRRCHELRVSDANVTWRVIYRIDEDAVVVVNVFTKKTPTTPDKIIKESRSRLRAYDAAR